MVKARDENKPHIVAYSQQHGPKATAKHFGIRLQRIYQLRHEAGVTQSSAKRKKANGAKRVTNGLGALPEKDALTWLERWRADSFELARLRIDRMKAETPSAAAVLAALRGGK